MGRSARSSIALASSAVVAAAALIVAFALPVAGQDPTVPPAATEKPGQGTETEKPGPDPKAQHDPKAPDVAVTLTGRVGMRTDVDGDPAYTLTVDGTAYEIKVGPPWWWDEKHPLKDLVGDSVTITGERHEGSTEVDLFTIDGEVVREPGRPPWAGGWKVVGERHPGWTQWKADKLAARAQGKGVGRPPWAGTRSGEDASD